MFRSENDDPGIAPSDAPTDPYSIQRMLHFGDSGGDEQSPSRRARVTATTGYQHAILGAQHAIPGAQHATPGLPHATFAAQHAPPQRATPSKRWASRSPTRSIAAPVRPPIAPRQPVASALAPAPRPSRAQEPDATPRAAPRAIAPPDMDVTPHRPSQPPNEALPAASSTTKPAPRTPAPRDADVTPRRSSARVRVAANSPAVDAGGSDSRRAASSTTTPRRSPRQTAPTRVQAQVKQGRPPSEIWQHFHEIKVNGKRVAVCKFCPDQLNNPKPGGNMTTHLMRNCKAVTDTIKQKLGQPANDTASTHVRATYMAPQDPAKKSEACAIDQATLNLLIVELVVVCALPFQVLESMAFKAFVGKLAPTLVVPPRQYITKSLLEDAAKVMRKRVIARINQQAFVSIVTDGWTDPNGDKIVNFMVVAPEMPSLFWSSWASGSEAHTSDNLTAKVKTVVEEIESLTNARVVGIVTDNASNMVGVWDRLRTFAIVGGGCAAHVLNLLMKNLFAHEVLKKVHSNCVQLSRFVRDHSGLLHAFKVALKDLRDRGEKRNGLTLPLPTRWYSVFSCLENILANREELYALFTSPVYSNLRQQYARKEKSCEKLAYITTIVEDAVFWENLRVVVRLIRPIRHAMGKLESDNEFPSGVYSWFHSLPHHEAYQPRQHDTPATHEPTPAGQTAGEADDENLPEPVFSAGYERSTPIVQGVLERFFRLNIKKRWTFVHTNAMAIAFYLDPRCSMDDFERNDERKARNAAFSCAHCCFSTFSEYK